MAKNDIQGPKVLVLKDSASDVMLAAAQKLNELGVPYELTSCDAPSPQWVAHAIKEAVEKGVMVIIVGLSSALSLKDVLDVQAGLPVIGVPIDTSHMLSPEALEGIAHGSRETIIAITKQAGEDGAAHAAITALRIVKAYEQYHSPDELFITISMN